MIPISNPSISHDKGIFIGRNIYTNAPVYIDTFIGPPKLPNPHVFICGTSGGGWAISLIWAMMILPLADALQNSLQNLTSRIAGVDNEQMAGRAIGMGAGIGAMVGYGIGTIKEQFKSPTSNTNNNINNGGNSNNGLRGFVNRVTSVINPNMNLSAEKDYEGNTNPIQNVIQTDSSYM